MKLSLAVMSLCAAAVWAQPAYEPFAQVKEFLQLSDAQVRTILANNGEWLIVGGLLSVRRRIAPGFPANYPGPPWLNPGESLPRPALCSRLDQDTEV